MSDVVKRIIADMGDRRGLRGEWNAIDDDMRAEIVAKWEGFAESALTTARTQHMEVVLKLDRTLDAERAVREAVEADMRLLREQAGGAVHMRNVEVTRRERAEADAAVMREALVEARAVLETALKAMKWANDKVLSYNIDPLHRNGILPIQSGLIRLDAALSGAAGAAMLAEVKRLRERLESATAFRVEGNPLEPDRQTTVEERLQRDARRRWVVKNGDFLLNKVGEWEYEPIPSSRDDDFVARTRFASVDEAFAAAAKHAGVGP